MSDYIIDQQDKFDDTDYLYEEFLKTANLCTDCRYHEKAHDTELCKFCLRKGMKTAGFINVNPSNQQKLTSMQLLREIDSSIK